MRKPKIEAPKTFEFNPNRKNETEIIRETREYELITPLFGGGVTTKQADEISVIRATEIRGHLRFWWRATRGGQFATLETLKKAEDKIFGSTDVYSALQIEIEVENRGQNFPPQNDLKGNPQPINKIQSPLSYVAFSLRDENNAQIIENVGFVVKLSYPSELTNDVNAALWAWELFGGLGARTRRGFGSIQNKNYLPMNKNAIEIDIQNGLSINLSRGNWLSDVPHLQAFASTKYKITSPRNTMIDTWKYLIDSYQRFRQFRRPTPFRSRSNWTEPDAIRRLFPRCVHPRHSIPKTTVDKFPRANFGLPIIFKFMGEADGDPPVTTLEGHSEKQKRLASPLIFRVVKCAEGKFIGIAIILSGIRMPTSGVILKDAPGNPTIQTDLTEAEASSAYVNDILNGNSDVLEAFLATL